MDAKSQRCGMCMHFNPSLGMCLVYGCRVSSDNHHVDERNAIIVEDYGCENFTTPQADEEWCRALEKAERHSVPWR